MIKEFLESWPLFQHAWIAGWLVAAMLSLLGILAVARDQIFVGATVAQCSTLGVAVGLWLETLGLSFGGGGEDHEHGHGGALPAALAVIGAVAAAAGSSAGPRLGRTSGETRNGWIYLAAASLGVLILTASPFGQHEVEHLATSSLIGAGRGTVWTFAVAATATALAAATLRQQLLVLAIDPAMCPAAGMHRRSWEVGLGVWTGVALGLSIRATGMLYAFGCLVLPPLAARGLCRTVASQFVVAPLIAVVVCVVAFADANYRDLPPAQEAIAALCAACLVTGGIGALMRRLRG